jgi:flagellar basal body P-ring formation protein FlgA
MNHHPKNSLLARNIVVFIMTSVFVPFLAANPLTACELRLRTQCNPAGPVVTLGDVADIESADAQQSKSLAAVELFPAPGAGEQRLLSVREIQDLLLLRGVNLTEHRFTGSSEVAVQTIVLRPRIAANKPVPAGEMQRIKRRVCEALLKYLGEHTTSPQTWDVQFELTDDLAGRLADPVCPLSIAGGCDPWTGRQRFDLDVGAAKASTHFVLDVNVRIVPPVVVARRQLARGAILREDDVELRRASAADNTQAGALHSVEEAVGHELVRPIPAGSPIASDSLRAPLAVHRGEVVTVYAQSGSIRIRTNARARDEGSVGELVAVESLLNRSTYYARVSGIREVEVYARPARVEGAADAASTAENNTGSIIR